MHEENDMEILAARANAGDTFSQMKLGLQLFQGGQILESVPWIEKAAAAEQLPAVNLLGVMHLNGLAVPLDLNRAATLLERASELGLKEANYTLAGMHAAGLGFASNHATAWRYLIQACRGGHSPAFRVAGLLYLLIRPESIHGVNLLRIAAARADGLAQVMLGAWLSRNGSAKDHSEAGYWLQQAAKNSMYTAKTTTSLQTASAKPASPPEPVWEELEPVAFPVVHRFAMQTLVPDVVYEIQNALPPLACEYLINLSASRLRPSMVVDPKTGRQTLNPVRSSHSMYFPPSMYDCVVSYIRNRMAEIAHLPASHAEPLSILRYTPGQEYKPHQDYFVGATADNTHTGQQGGQRIVTVFAYLNDVEEGGDTEFPEYNLRVHTACGKAVKFMNLDAQGAPNPMTLHAGCPVIQGKKWLATFWFREHPFAWSI